MKKIIITILLAIVAMAGQGQEITGRVTDEQTQPMPFANVVFLNRSDSAFIAGAVTKDDGTFSINTDKQDGLLKVSNVGYIIRYIDARQGNVGDIRMQPYAKELGEVVVKGERPQYKMTTGGMTVDIQNSLLKDVGTADDVLSMLPQIQGSDGNFTVFAKGKPEIYINNKKVQNARELKQLKSTDIKSVDVITSPGAKYNAESKNVFIAVGGDGTLLQAVRDNPKKVILPLRNYGNCDCHKLEDMVDDLVNSPKKTKSLPAEHRVLQRTLPYLHLKLDYYQSFLSECGFSDSYS